MLQLEAEVKEVNQRLREAIARWRDDASTRVLHVELTSKPRVEHVTKLDASESQTASNAFAPPIFLPLCV